jgi:polyphosphate kinase
MGHDKTLDTDQAPAHEKLKGKRYAQELKKLHAELVSLQEWIKHKGLKVCIVFEGRDGAGKGGTIKAITERVSPRVFRVVALPAPTEREKSQMYLQRYVPHLPAAGEVVIFDRSWYNRAGVERVMDFCPEDQVKRFLQITPLVEKAIVESGIILLKYWLEVSPEEQTRRLESRIHDGRKIWKLSPMDLQSYGRWYDYSRRQEEGSTQHHHASIGPHPLQRGRSRENRTAQAAKGQGLPRARLPVQVHPRTLLTDGSPEEKCHGRHQRFSETAGRTSGPGAKPRGTKAN